MTDAERDAAGAATTSARSVARAGIWEVSGFVLPQGYVLISSAFIARYLGASGIGRVTLIASVQAALTVTFTWGMPYALTRFFATLIGGQRLAEMHGLIRWCYRIAFAGAFGAFAAILIAALAGADPRTAWVLAAIATSAAVVHSVPTSVLTGSQRWREARIVGIVTGGAAVAAKVVILVRGGGIVGLVFVDLCTAVVNLAGTYMLSRRVVRTLPQPTHNQELRREVLRFAALASVSVVVTFVVYQRTEIFFLAHYASDAAIARYSIPYSLVTALLIIPTAAGSVLSPAFATLWGAGEAERMRTGFGRAVRLVVQLSVVLAGLAAVVGTGLIRIVYGPAFGHVDAVLIILLCSLPLVPLSTLSSAVLRAIGTLRALTLVGVVAAIANVALAFVLIPPYGAVGAALANTIAQVAGSLPLILYARGKVGGVAIGAGTLLRTTVLVALAATAGRLATDQMTVWVGTAVAGVAYLAVVAAAGRPMRILTRPDGAWIIDLVDHRARGIPRALVRYTSGL